MAEMKTLNGYEVVDAKARQDIATLNEKEPDLSNYYTKAQTDSAIGEAVSGIKIPEVDLTPYAKVADMPTKVSQLENDKGYLTEHQSLDGYATTKYVEDIRDEVADDVAAYLEDYYYTSAQVDDKIAKAATGDVDLTNYYTKEETDTAISDAIANIDTDTYYFDESTFAWDFGTAFLPDDLLEFTQRALQGERVNLFLKDADGGWYPASFKVDGTDITIFRPLSFDDIDKQQKLRPLCIYYSSSNETWLAMRSAQRTYTVASANYVDTAITNALSGIATAEGGSY